MAGNRFGTDHNSYEGTCVSFGTYGSIDDGSSKTLVQMELDEDNLFKMPVVKAFPEVGEAYLQRIASPMDFRTIEEERIHRYRSIRELQEDLVLVFGNCMEYNGEGTDYYETAR